MMQKHLKCSDWEDHRNKFKNLDVNDCSFFSYKNWTKIPTRGFQDGNQGRTLGKTERF
jgi:hypothetical protein